MPTIKVADALVELFCILADCDGLNEKCAPKTHVLKGWSLVGGAVWQGYGIFRKCSFAGGCVSLGVSFEGL